MVLYYSRPDPMRGVMQKYQVVRGFVFLYEPVEVGSIIEVDAVSARRLLASGKIVPYAAPVVENRIEEPVTREPRGRGRPRGGRHGG